MSATDASARYPSLSDRHVFVSGGGSGIGDGIVEAFAAQGARVSFADIAEDASHALVERLAPAARHAPRFSRCDLTDVAALREVLAEAAARDGDVAVLVNNAANEERHAPADVTPDIGRTASR